MSPAKIDLPAPPFFVRVARALSITTAEPPKEPEDFNAGSDFASAQAVRGEYDPKLAMSALKASPWVYTSVSRVESSLAALPLLVEVKDSEGKWTADPTHPVALRLQSPTSWQTSRQWRKQLVRYLLPVGWVCVLQMERDRDGVPTGLVILHPHRCEPIPLRFGAPGGWQYDEAGKRTRYDANDVMFFTMSTVGDGPHGAMLGMGWVQPQHYQIETGWRTAADSAKKARKGKPDAVYHPSDPKTTWAAKVVSEMRKMLARLLQEADGGVAVLSGAGTLTPLDWSAKEMEANEVQKQSMATAAAVSGVPPTLFGSQAANFATANVEKATYYESTLMPIASDIDDVLTSSVRSWGFVDVRVRHDFSGVKVLQEDRTARLDRVDKWRVLGASPADAAEYEGFDDAPELAEIAVPPPEAAPTTEPEPNPEEERHARDLEIQSRALARLLVQDGVSDDEIRQEAQVLADLASRRAV